MKISRVLSVYLKVGRCDDHLPACACPSTDAACLSNMAFSTLATPDWQGGASLHMCCCSRSIAVADSATSASPWCCQWGF